MLDVKFVRENIELVRQMLKSRQSELDLTPLLELDETRRRILVGVEEKKHRRNVASEEISKLKKEGKDASNLVEQMRDLSQEIRVLDQQLAEVEQKFREFLLIIPNVPDSGVPVGRDEKDNVEIRTWGEKPAFDFKPSPTGKSGRGLEFLISNVAQNLPGRGSLSIGAPPLHWSAL